MTPRARRNILRAGGIAAFAFAAVFLAGLVYFFIMVIRVIHAD
jgi:hypothetical protein